VLSATINLNIDDTMSMFDNNKGVEKMSANQDYFETRVDMSAEPISVDEFLADEQTRESSTNRRDFLKFLGFSVAAATIAACEAPVTKAIPYVVKPEDVTPGKANWYASNYYDGNTFASIMVKTREGRPIHIKGNKDFGLASGGISPEVAASVLSLYDSERLKNPLANGADSSWADADTSIIKSLNSIKDKGGKIAIVSNTVISPSTQIVIAEFTEKFGNVEHIQYDAVSYSAMRSANEKSFGKSAIPSYDFSKAEAIVSVGADFLNGWLMSNAYRVQYAANRKPENGGMSKHFQFEANMSIAGANADVRGMFKPSEYAAVLAAIAEGVGAGSIAGVNAGEAKKSKEVQEAIAALKAAKGKSLVVCGENNEALQIITNKINHYLGNYTSTINLNDDVNLFQSQDAAMNALVENVISGNGVSAVIFYGSNPVYTHPKGKAFGDALSKIGLTISFASWNDETAAKCQYVCPDHHALESWNDYSPMKSVYALAQPTIKPIHNTASAQESFMVWSGNANRAGRESTAYYNKIRAVWELNGYPLTTGFATFDDFWNITVHNGNSEMEVIAAENPVFAADLAGLSAKLPKAAGVEVVMYTKTSMGIGLQANNPWLQEMADPLSKITWDNYITMNYKEAQDAGYNVVMDQEHGATLAKITVNGVSLELPVIPTPGQAKGTVGVALGYGRGENGERIGKGAFKTKEYGGYEENDGKRVPIGQNAFKFVSVSNNSFVYCGSAKVEKQSGEYPIASTQFQLTAMGRTSIVKETTLESFLNDDHIGYNLPHALMTHHGPEPVSKFDLWASHPVEHIGHRWALSIDLNSCIGCGTCLIACQSENNVPVVGKDEVRRGREMAWLRLDRYYKSEDELAIGTKKEDFDFTRLEKNIDENPSVVFMPMLCQHCNHAPCETVCPVAATTHSNEGLNQMTYNRCIGTRYCANNCPYKVRRFNWFNYPSYKKFTEINPSQDDLGRMVLNPDVTVRTRGVMEKCSLCVQRIQEGKLKAKVEARPVVDGDVSTACADACPTHAITMGDWNDTESAVRKASSEHRAYQALEEIGVKPNIWYQVKVRNHENAGLRERQLAVAKKRRHDEERFANHGHDNHSAGGHH
jgi:molybdopterin-containing oxidoreductase family iron-sulfur binding subunit